MDVLFEVLGQLSGAGGASGHLVPLSPGHLVIFGAGFPRGPGFYFHPAKLLALVAVYFVWVRTCWWVIQDCEEVGMPANIWNPLLLFGGLAGVLLVWVLPFFWIGFLGLLALYLAPTLFYVSQRNEKVPPGDQVLTPAHLKSLANRYLLMKFALGGSDKGQKPIPLRFIGKSSGGSQQDKKNAVARAQESRGYRAALEMVYEAIQARATDIHMEPTKEEMTVRYRIDGILQSTSPFGRAMGDAVLNIFKVLADLDITEKRKPQDGSFSAEVLGEDKPTTRRKGVPDPDDVPSETETRQIDFRVATAGSVVGEKLVMRILDRSRQVTGLGQVVTRQKLRDQIRAIVTQPHGLFIVCGPTGAGKSTTLYGCLSEIDRFQKNVITVENPVEYNIPNVTQIEINPKAGKTFASELRSILRQDPDVIYIGEIRDQETAEIACQAAQTGHMVFTTLHANDTVTALGRLLDLGVQPFMVASSISAVLGQRLVRLLCPRCKQAYRPNPQMLLKANLPADKIKNFYRPPKRSEDEDDPLCSNCSGTGYWGRAAIFEMLVINDGIREMIRGNPDLDAIRQEAVKNGMVYLQQDGMRLVMEGTTSIEELLRVSK
jgi:type II secretory ATPase GspE/PulE/Tfp pilus assembly ATPase PilB-like protein